MVDTRSETSWTLPDYRLEEVWMPFCEMAVMSQRREFAELAVKPGVNIRELCRRYGISPTTGYKWRERYGSGGLAALAERSRRPHSSPQRTSSAIEAKVLR